MSYSQDNYNRANEQLRRQLAECDREKVLALEKLGDANRKLTEAGIKVRTVSLVTIAINFSVSMIYWI
jgi:hypothetical protein